MHNPHQHALVSSPHDQLAELFPVPAPLRPGTQQRHQQQHHLHHYSPLTFPPDPQQRLLDFSSLHSTDPLHHQQLYTSHSFSNPRPPTHWRPPQLPLPVVPHLSFQIGEVVQQRHLHPPHLVQPGKRPPYHFSPIALQPQRRISHLSSPPAAEPSDPFSLRRSTLQGPAPPRNVLMMASGGGVATLGGPSKLQNIHDPYAVQPVLRGREASGSSMGPSAAGSVSTFPGSSSSHTHQNLRYSPPRLAAAASSSSSSSTTLASGSNAATWNQSTASRDPVGFSDFFNSPGQGSRGAGDTFARVSAAAYGTANVNGDFAGNMTVSSSNGLSESRSNGSNGRDDSNDGGEGSGRRSGSGDDGDGNEGGGGSPSSAKEKEKAARKANPLVDLIETETAYVSELSKIIKKVAGAWSRSNFPPAELDTMFRNVESIYRVNRSFLKSLKEIGPTPSSPRALGDLLMRWIDDLETPYLRYCDNYFTDFDDWPSIQGNSKLPPLLQSVSEAMQADGSPTIFSDKKRQPGQVWTLDQLFALPQIRLKYYKKLYARLLKSTQSGRSDHRLLVGANEKLDELLERSKKRIAMSVLDEGPLALKSRQSGGSSVGDTTRTTGRDSANAQSVSSRTSLSAEAAKGSGLAEPGSSLGMPATTMSIPERSYSPLSLPSLNLPTSSETTSSFMTPSKDLSVVQPDPRSSGSSSTPRDSQGLTSDDLETRLDTSKTVDIFTMKPKICQLRFRSPNIPFKRSLRRSADVVIYFTPSTTGQEIVLRRAHLFLLTDLFLICERMTAQEKADRLGVADMWLLYPPLAGKHLRVSDSGAVGNSMSVNIMRKETLTILLESKEAKQDWIEQLEECNKFASNLGLRVKTGFDAEAGGTKGGSENSLQAVRDNVNAPSLSPAISITPSSRTGAEEETSQEGRDTTVLAEDLAPFSLEDSDLSRVNSFNSFVTPALKTSTGSDSQDRALSNGASPALSSVFARPPEPLSPSYPPNAFNGGRPTLQHKGSLPPPPPAPPMHGQFGNTANLAMSPPMGPKRASPADMRPGMIFRPPSQTLSPPLPQGQMPRNNGLPHLPTSSPPQHLINGMPGKFAQRPSRPPPPQMNGAGARPRPGYQSQERPPPPRPPFHSNSMSSQSNGYMHGRPPNDPSRRPSAPDLRARAGMDTAMRSASDGRSSAPGRSRSASSAHSGPPTLPSDFLKQAGSRPQESFSPPSSPTLKKRGPKSSTVAAQMRCRLYLKQSHAQWKALGNARIKVFHLMPDDVKQLVVENDKKSTPIISSIILPDGVERVGKVGIAIELSDNGSRTGIVYMIHLRSEESALALFGQLLEGSDRTILAADRGPP